MSKMVKAIMLGQYNERLAWIGRFREFLPMLLEIGESLGAPEPTRFGLGCLSWEMPGGSEYASIMVTVERFESVNSILRIAEYGNSICFRHRQAVSGLYWHSLKVDDPKQLAATAKEFFQAMLLYQPI